MVNGRAANVQQCNNSATMTDSKKRCIFKVTKSKGELVRMIVDLCEADIPEAAHALLAVMKRREKRCDALVEGLKQVQLQDLNVQLGTERSPVL